MKDDWDVIVIGSGLGGLTAAAYLAALGKKTIVLEQHYVAGGNAHVFRRMKKFEFDVGVHYVGDCNPGGMLPTILGALGVGDRVEWLEMDPEGFDTLRFPGIEFRVPASWDKYRARLVETFPDDETGLHRFIDILHGVQRESGKVRLPVEPADLPRLLEEAPNFLKWALRPLSELFDECNLGQKARAVLAAESGDYGMPPSKTPVVLHAAVIGGYMKGAYYPKGGGQVIPAALVESLRANGGELRTRTRVERILVEEGRVQGVRLEGGEELRAPIVVSNGDLKRTLLDMVGREHLAAATVEKVDTYRMALPVFVVYLGLEMDLRGKMPNTNYWSYSTFDLEKMYAEAAAGKVPEDTFFFISVGSVKDPETETIAPKGCTSMEIMSLVPANYDLWGVDEGPAAGERYHRKANYRSVKEELTEHLIDAAEKVIPGLREHIVWKEAATPVTHERYTLSTGGTSYGIELAVDQFGPNRPSPKTEIEGLFLAGASTVFGHGISGVMRGGVGTASAIAGRDLMTEAAAGVVFGDPAKLGPAPRDAWEASR